MNVPALPCIVLGEVRTMKKSYAAALCGAAGMLALILDGRTALQGAAAGIDLCMKTVIPALFPFLFLCGILTDSLWGCSLPKMGCLGIPAGAESLLLPALLGGYPAGARQIGQAWREQKLTRKDAEHLLCFCSNAGPAFLFGITALQFESLADVWALWCIHILSALFTGLLGGGCTSQCRHLSGRNRSICTLLTDCVKTMGCICGWVLLFQILLTFLDRWFFWALPVVLQVLLTGLLELSSGCCALGQIADPQLRFLLCSGMLSFGGFCVVMQTASVLEGLSLKPYLRGKLMQTALSAALALGYLRLGWPVFWTGLLLVPPGQKKKWIFPHRRCIMPVSPPGGKIHAVSEKN